jgi:hypothetical protein
MAQGPTWASRPGTRFPPTPPHQGCSSAIHSIHSSSSSSSLFSSSSSSPPQSGDAELRLLPFPPPGSIQTISSSARTAPQLDAHRSTPNKPSPRLGRSPHPYSPRRHDLDSSGSIRLPTAAERIPAHAFPKTTTHLVVRPSCRDGPADATPRDAGEGARRVRRWDWDWEREREREWDGGGCGAA